MKQNEQERVDQVLSAWDGAKRAEAPAFFYSRLRARMERSESPVKSWLFRPAFVVATLIVVIIINVFIYLQPTTSTTITSSDDEISIQSIAAEYNLSDNTLEEINQ